MKRVLFAFVAVAVLSVAAPAQAGSQLESDTPTRTGSHGGCSAGQTPTGEWSLACIDKGGARFVYRFPGATILGSPGVLVGDGPAHHRIETVIKGSRVVVRLPGYVDGWIVIQSVTVHTA